MSTLGAKFKLDELDEARNSIGDVSYGEDGKRGGGRSLVGGAADGGRREEDAIRDRIAGRFEPPGETGDSTRVEAADVVRERVKVTGEGEGVLEEEGDEEPDALRRGCNGWVGLSSGFAVDGRWSIAPTVIPLGRTRAGLDRLRIK